MDSRTNNKKVNKLKVIKIIWSELSLVCMEGIFFHENNKVVMKEESQNGDLLDNKVSFNLLKKSKVGFMSLGDLL